MPHHLDKPGYSVVSAALHRKNDVDVLDYLDRPCYSDRAVNDFLFRRSV